MAAYYLGTQDLSKEDRKAGKPEGCMDLGKYPGWQTGVHIQTARLLVCSLTVHSSLPVQTNIEAVIFLHWLT